jgi:hypothetical protein
MQLCRKSAKSRHHSGNDIVGVTIAKDSCCTPPDPHIEQVHAMSISIRHISGS